MGSFSPLMLLMLGGGRFLRSGMIRKVLFYSMFGWMGLLLGGGFSIRDFLIIPTIAPMLGGMLGITNSGAAPTVPSGSLV